MSNRNRKRTGSRNKRQRSRRGGNPRNTVSRESRTLGTSWAIRTPEEKRDYGRRIHHPESQITHQPSCGSLTIVKPGPCDCNSPP